MKTYHTLKKIGTTQSKDSDEYKYTKAFRLALTIVKIASHRMN